MSAPDAAVTGLCFRCGGPLGPERESCPYCGMPVILAPEAASPYAGPPSVLPPSWAGPPSPAEPSPSVVPAYFAGPAGPGPVRTAGPTLTAGPAPRRPLGRRGLIAIGLVAVVLVGVGATALTNRLLRPGPAKTVHDYFAAVSAGDGARALRYVQTAPRFSIADFPL